jgi:hypothetical protein
MNYKTKIICKRSKDKPLDKKQCGFTIDLRPLYAQGKFLKTSYTVS